MKKLIKISLKERYALAITMVIVVIVGLFFLKPYLILIILASIVAFIFNPVYKWFLRKGRSPATASSLTLLVSLLTIVIPVTLVVAVTTVQVANLINVISQNTSTIDFGALGQRLVDATNQFLQNIGLTYQITPQQVTDSLTTAIQNLGSAVLENAWSSINGIFGFITIVIIYIYVFMSLLKNQEVITRTFHTINPLGRKVSELYFQRMGSMTKAMVKGQFVIAAMQGTTDAVLIYIGGIHTAFFFFVMLLVALSIIPLGGGIVALPIGVIMILTGNITGGLIVILGHLLIVTNIDNVMRPRLVPEEARLDPALTMLAVFSGVALFGFIGIVLGPVLMIVLVTTLQVYLEVFKNEDAVKESSKKTKKSLFGRFKKSTPD